MLFQFSELEKPVVSYLNEILYSGINQYEAETAFKIKEI